MKSRIQWVAVVSGLALCLTACTHVHEYGDWITEREAACTQEGVRYRVCYTCGERQMQMLPVCHEYVAGVCRLCGDGAAAIPITTASSTGTVLYTTTVPTDGGGDVSASTHSTTTTTTTMATGTGTNSTPSRRNTSATHSTAPQGWTVYKQQAVVDTLFSMVGTATSISTDLAEVCNSPDAGRILDTIDSARRRMQSVRQTIAVARQQLLQEEPVPSIDTAYATAADHAQAMLALCDRMMAATATADNAATVAWQMMGDIRHLLASCAAVQQSIQAISPAG